MPRVQSLRPDRLITLPPCERDGRVEYSVNTGQTGAAPAWAAATVYLGADVDAWRGTELKQWNQACGKGLVPAGTVDALWNCFFDLELPVDTCQVRAVDAQTADVLWVQDVDPADWVDTIVMDHRDFVAAAGGELPGKWTLKDEGLAATSRPSLVRVLQREKQFLPDSNRHYRYRLCEDEPEGVRIDPGVKGWHRVYVGMEPYSAFRLSLGAEGAPE
jgi:hypothetical protein